MIIEAYEEHSEWTLQRPTKVSQHCRIFQVWWSAVKVYFGRLVSIYLISQEAKEDGIMLNPIHMCSFEMMHTQVYPAFALHKTLALQEKERLSRCGNSICGPFVVKKVKKPQT